MKKIFLILFLLTISICSIAAEDCDESPGILGKKCLNDEIGKDDIKILIGSSDQLKNFCNSCKSDVNSSLYKLPAGKAEKASSLGRATLDEFQKEITFISLDLMKTRSSYKLDFDPAAAMKSCSFENLKRPTCHLNETQAKLFEDQKRSIQNATATELASILSDKNDKPDGLLLHIERENNCHISDKTALFSHTRFIEESITPNLLTTLKNLRIPSNKDVQTYLADKKLDEKTVRDIDLLQQHPLFQVLLKDSTKLNNFLTNIKSEDSNKAIIEKLYDSKQATQFGKTIKERCEKSFKKTSDFLQSIYCESSPVYVADDIKSMEAVSGSTFEKMDDNKAEVQLQTLCAQLDTADSKAVSFSKIRKSINEGNNQSLVDYPLVDFKINAFNAIFSETKINICNAQTKTPPCNAESTSSECKMLKYSELMKTSKLHKDLANSSSDNINLILRSIVGEGLPQKDGKVDTAAVALLKDEGILPGGDTSSRPPQQTAAAFNRTVNSAAIPQPQQAAKQAAPTSSPTKPEEVQPSYAQSPARESDTDDEQDSTSSRSDSPTKHKSPKKQNSKFSNLSDDEQQRIMDMMKRSKKAGGKTPTAASSDEQDSSDAFDTAGSAMANIAAQAAASGASVASVAQKAASAGATAGKKAVLDPTKKSSSLNDAMVDANANRQLASSGQGLSSSNAQVSISKSGTNENEIKIKVADAELTQVNEFKEKLKVLLNAHSQEISVAGAGEKFVVKLNNFEINVLFNKQLGTYEALCKDSSIPKDYLKTISTYFNVTLKGSTGKREALVNTLKQ